jgi:hypothetical protein
LFISHQSTNNAAAVALRDWLTEEGFGDVFLDIDPERGRTSQSDAGGLAPAIS